MADFDGLRRRRKRHTPIDPQEIFLRLPNPPGIDDLWKSQADALSEWHNRREERDIVIKLNTGGGKTLVGLLIAQSIMNEHHGPVLYLCPTTQLQGQILQHSRKYGIPAVPYSRGPGIPLDEEFLGANAVMVATYHALFNGRSKFGISGSTRGPIDIAGIILDDAHTAFSNMRDIFSLCIDRESHEDLYDEITTLFRDDFGQQDRQGTYDDILAQRESHILEVPYVSWMNRSDEVRQAISDVASSDFPMVWALVRDSFKSCHALVSKDRVVITPFYPNVSLFPSFARCQHRIYMSATVADDSSIVRTFDADHSSVANPISPTSLAGVGERMILIPEVVGIESSQATDDVKALAKEISANAGVVVLTSSTASAANWSDVATVAVSDEVAGAVDSLVRRRSNGPFVFPNRYDGLDLPADSCRLLVMSGLPRGTNDYDLFMAAVLEGGEGINVSVAQRVEQGMGRGTRGSGDHCVVMLLGADLVAWVSIGANLALMTPDNTGAD